MVYIGNDWDNILHEDFLSSDFQKLNEFLKEEYENEIIYPKKENVFNALRLTPYNKVKVVIFGQDPYHEPNQAHGLAFSVLEGVKIPPSLRNIYKEIESDLGIKMNYQNTNLTSWANQGILLLNNVLTVRRGLANSHKKKGWEEFTDTIVKHLNERVDPVIFVFWGNNAKTKQKLVTGKQHIILTAPHPSPLSAYQGFFGCKHFSKINEELKKMGKEPIDFKL